MVVVSVACSSIELVQSVIRPTVQWRIQMVGVSVACSSIELVPSVIRPTVQWRIQMVGVSVACSSMELVPSVDLLHSGGYRWWVSVSPVPL